MPKKKDISDISLELTKSQKSYLSSETTTLEGLGISKSEYNQWKKEPLFKWIEHFLYEGYIEYEGVSEVQTSAAVLVHAGYSYAAVESAMSLEPGTIVDWMREDTDSGEDFSHILACVAEEAAAESVPGISDEEHQNREAAFQKQEQMIPLILMGKNNTEIAAELEVSRQTISAWRNDEDWQIYFKREVVQYRESQRASLALLHSKAYETLHELLASKEESIKLKAAVEILKNTTNRIS